MFRELDKPLDIIEILEGVHHLPIGRRIKYYDKVGSTNDIAYHLAEGGEEEGTIVIADEQTAGKGRQDRKWSSARFKGIYLSIILRPEVEALSSPRFTMMASVGIVKAIEDVARLKAEIKWPNDIMLGTKKVGGILAEIKLVENFVKFAVLGIGINVNHLDTDFPTEIASLSTSLLMESTLAVSREQLVIKLLSHLSTFYPMALQKDFSPLIAQWKELCPCHNGCMVTVKNGSLTYRGITRGVTNIGELMIEMESGERVTLALGDLSIIPGDTKCF
ncbi:MAG: biotin--[acetyl-CoA-carboxylase] ligase [Acidobacteriota bacterium]